MTKEDKQVQARMEQLKKVMFLNEQRMRLAFIKYEKLLAQRESLISSIDALRVFRSRKRHDGFVDNTGQNGSSAPLVTPANDSQYARRK